jgi:hypothetical protein
MLVDAGERVPPDDDFNDIRCDRYTIMPLETTCSSHFKHLLQRGESTDVWRGIDTSHA